MVKLFTAEDVKNFNTISGLKSQLLAHLNYPDMTSEKYAGYDIFITTEACQGDEPVVGDEDYWQKGEVMSEYLELYPTFEEFLRNFYECNPHLDPSFGNEVEDFDCIEHFDTDIDTDIVDKEGNSWIPFIKGYIIGVNCTEVWWDELGDEEKEFSIEKSLKDQVTYLQNYNQTCKFNCNAFELIEILQRKR